MKKFLYMILITAFLGFGVISISFKKNVPTTPDAAEINDAVITVMQNDDKTKAVSYLTNQITQSFEEMDAARKNRDMILQIILCLIIGAFTLSGIWMYLYCNRYIIKPFRKLQNFASRIAAGNLDTPLEMDKNNLFGAFTESFDLMREELGKARENERNADRSKKELVASLSHDIKTPVASIKAVAELMLVTQQDEKDRKRLETISEKAEQINSLITDMFHATLEELQALRVNVIEIQSTAIPGLIKNSDYKGRVKPFDVPSSIVIADPLRLQQILDNIISNSYKYADTDIQIHAVISGRFVVIEISDFGAGISEDELPLLFNKFYRGKNADDKSGYGLGLYISKYLLEQMSGELNCENHPDGFTVKVMLRLAG